MTINIVMSCSYDSKLLEYWPIVSKMWKNYNFNPILGITNNFTEKQGLYLSSFGKVYFFPRIENIKNETQGKIIKYFICNELNDNDIVIFLELNLLVLNVNWLSEMIANLDDSKNNIIFTWPEFKSEYLMGKVHYFKSLFNLNNSSYTNWLEFLIHSQDTDEDKEGIVFSEDFSEKGFLYNSIVRQDGLVNIKLIPRNDIFFISDNSYLMEKRTDWYHFKKLEIDSDYDILGSISLLKNLDYFRNILEILGLYKISEVESKRFKEFFYN